MKTQICWRSKTVATSIALILASVASTAFAREAWNSANDPQGMRLETSPALETRLEKIPTSGSMEKLPWSDSYWPSYQGGIARRWREGRAGDTRSWTYGARGVNTLGRLKRESIERVRVMSPAEKLDVLNGDYNYTFLEEIRKGLASEESNFRGDATIRRERAWEGICHGWASAAIHHTEPSPVVVTNKDGIKIPFGTSDINALLSYYYANFSQDSNFMGGRCNINFSGDAKLESTEIAALYELSDKPEVRVNEITSLDKAGIARLFYFVGKVTDRQTGRLMVESLNEQEKAELAKLTATRAQWIRKMAQSSSCRDTNAGSFHITLGNRIGLQKQGFVADIDPGYQVWNQPIHAYESRMLSEQAPSAGAAPGTVKEINVDTTMYYISEVAQHESPLGRNQNVAKKEYKYRLELNASGEIIGGAWISEDRPDFMWDVKKANFDQPRWVEFKKVLEQSGAL
jgi:hypothetical protein